MLETRWDPVARRPFVINHNLKTTAWAPSAPPAARATAFHDPWEKRIDAELKKEFFYNVETKELAWELPSKQQSHM